MLNNCKHKWGSNNYCCYDFLIIMNGFVYLKKMSNIAQKRL